MKRHHVGVAWRPWSGVWYAHARCRCGWQGPKHAGHDAVGAVERDATAHDEAVARITHVGRVRRCRGSSAEVTTDCCQSAMAVRREPTDLGEPRRLCCQACGQVRELRLVQYAGGGLRAEWSDPLEGRSFWL
ncbi:MAG: hypothetical protein ACRDYA_18640 [Egibacteraceae bacterium]